MRGQAYYWLHLVPFLVAIGLAALLIVVSSVLSISARGRRAWLPLLFTGLFGGLLFVSPPFRMLAHPLSVGQMSWVRLADSAGMLLRDHAHLDSFTAAWLPEFLAGVFVFALVRLALRRLAR